MNHRESKWRNVDATLTEPKDGTTRFGGSSPDQVGDKVDGVATMSRPGRESGAQTPPDLIAGAIQTEKEAAWFYEMMAEMTSDDEARKTLLVLAKDEASHAAALTNL